MTKWEEGCVPSSFFALGSGVIHIFFIYLCACNQWKGYIHQFSKHK